VPGYTRRQLKEDKFAETAQGAAEWATGHRMMVLVAVGAVLVVVLAVAGFFAWHTSQTEQANTQLAAAMRTYETPLTPAGTPQPAGETGATFSTITDRSKAAQKQFSAIADNHSMVSAGKIARYMSGMALIEAGDKSGAEQELKKAADFSDKDVAAMAKMALASLYRDSNRTSDAVAIYKEVSDHPTATVSKSAAQLALASIYEKTDPHQAAQIYQQVQKDDPQSAAAQMAAQKLSRTK
jgi:predicted negative regulator of RcsB-dependent stress response